MPCGCKEFAASRCKCSRYREAFPDCECEDQSVGDHDLGPVGDKEILVRMVFDPEDIVDGNVKPEYYRRDVSKKGMSVDRSAHIADADLVSKMMADRRYDKFKQLAFVAAMSGRIKQMLWQGRRSFCIYDTGTPTHKSHADICQNVYYEKGSGVPYSRETNLEVGRQIHKAFTRPSPLPGEARASLVE